MVIITPGTGLCSDEAKGRIGRPSGFGAYVFGEMYIGEYNDRCGVYQKQPTKRGKKMSMHRDNWPSNPNSLAQQANRFLFKNAVIAWNALDIETMAEYNARVFRPGQYGINIFIKEYMKANR